MPNFLSGGTPQTGTLLFNGNAPPGSVITLASDSPAASVPASVTATGQLAAFAITTRQVTTSTPVIITATWRSKTVSTRMILQPPPTLLLPAPVPEFPASGSSVTSGTQVAFFWQPVTGAASYELQVATSSAFTPPLVLDQPVTGGNEFDTSTLPVGTLFWRVRALDSNGNPGAWSVTFQLTVTP